MNMNLRKILAQICFIHIEISLYTVNKVYFNVIIFQVLSFLPVEEWTEIHEIEHVRYIFQ